MTAFTRFKGVRRSALKTSSGAGRTSLPAAMQSSTRAATASAWPSLKKGSRAQSAAAGSARKRASAAATEPLIGSECGPPAGCPRFRAGGSYHESVCWDEPFGPEGWDGDHKVKAGLNAPEPALEQ